MKKIFLSSESPSHSLYTDEKYVDGKNYIEIECITLKDIFNENHIEKCDILKMDCEGAEFEILYNASEDIFKKVKEIRLEYHNKENNHIDSLIEFLKKDFKLTKFRPDSDYSGMAWFKRTHQLNF